MQYLPQHQIKQLKIKAKSFANFNGKLSGRIEMDKVDYKALNEPVDNRSFSEKVRNQSKNVHLCW